MLHSEQHHGGRTGMLLPAQHEVDEKRNEGQGKQPLRNRHPKPRVTMSVTELLG